MSTVPAGWDVCDWIEVREKRGMTTAEIKAELFAVIKSTPIWEPPEIAPQAADVPPPPEDPGEDIIDIPIGIDDVGEPQERKTILLGHDEHRVISESIAELAHDLGLFQRGGILVRVTRQEQPDDGITRAPATSTIKTLPAAALRARLTRRCEFQRANSNGDIIPAHPAQWLVSGIDAAGEWPGVPVLTGISDTPVLRADGTIHQRPGYDRTTGVLFVPNGIFDELPTGLERCDALDALAEIEECVCDFHFEAAEHKSAWLAGLLTPLARFAYTGSTPLFLIDANVAGAGKGMLAQIIGRIIGGRPMSVSSYTDDDSEMEKRITSIAMAGDRMILLDNINGPFGCPSIDRALTGESWKARILGENRQFEGPLSVVFYATGNNIQIAHGSDISRRVIHIRLDVLEERPEERDGFRHPDLLAWVTQHRPRLVRAALIILSAWFADGRRAEKLTPFGSFEAWSGLVRQAVVWLGLPDPCLTRQRLADQSDIGVDALAEFIAAMQSWDSWGRGIIAADLIRELYGDNKPRDEAANLMRSAIENLIGCPPGRTPTARSLGNYLRRNRRRVIAGKCLEPDSTKGEHGRKWRVIAVDSVSYRNTPDST